MYPKIYIFKMVGHECGSEFSEHPIIFGSFRIRKHEEAEKQKEQNHETKKATHTTPETNFQKTVAESAFMPHYSKEKMGSKKTCALHSIEVVYRGDLGQMNLMVKMTSRKSQGFVVKMPPKRPGRPRRPRPQPPVWARRVWAASAGKTC